MRDFSSLESKDKEITVFITETGSNLFFVQNSCDQVKPCGCWCGLGFGVFLHFRVKAPTASRV